MNAVTSTTAAKMKALREAKKLGCSGAHQTGDGVWRPCSSAESLAKIVPSSPSAIGPISAPRRQQRDRLHHATKTRMSLRILRRHAIGRVNLDALV